MRSSLFKDTSPPNDNNNIIIYYSACLGVLVIIISKVAFVRDSFRVIQHQETLPSLNLQTLHLNSTEIFKVINGLFSAMI